MPKCKDCGEPLKWAHEIHQGELCGGCGPGSLKHQQVVGYKGGRLTRASETKGPDVVIKNPDGTRQELYKVLDENGVVKTITADEWSQRNEMKSGVVSSVVDNPEAQQAFVEQSVTDPDATLDLRPKEIIFKQKEE